MTKYLQEALKLTSSIQIPVDKLDTSDPLEQLFTKLVSENVDVDITDKGMFGGRQIEFVQEVYYVPKNPTGDVSQPIGILTQSDLNNYCIFRKNDRLSFKYESGDAGKGSYSAKKNGQEEYTTEFDWSDALIQELIDEGACKLL